MLCCHGACAGFCITSFPRANSFLIKFNEKPLAANFGCWKPSGSVSTRVDGHDLLSCHFVGKAAQMIDAREAG